MSAPRAFAAVVLVSFAVVGGLLTALFSQFVRAGTPTAAVAATLAVPGVAQGVYPVDYSPPLPGDAPDDLRAAVTRGYEWVQVYSAGAGNGLRCSNCHFRGGITDGGLDGGISLVGAAARRPLDFRGKVQQCARINLDAPSVPAETLGSVDTYLLWLSKGVPLYADVPWLGLAPLTRPAADTARGQQVFTRVCAQCHGPDGQGTPIAPPVWGDRSFTSQSNMTRPGLLARFVLLNMPRENPSLSPAEAVDAASFVLAQPRRAPRGR